MQPFSLLIKPASADCNLRCDYCFYLEKSALYPDSQRHRMAPEVLERLISSYMATNQPEYVFGWQGGEPTLMGVDFFREVTRLQQKYGRPGSVVANGLQTNATLIDDEFAAHLAQYNFLVGVSLDGPPELHDTYRTTASGQGSHAQVLEGIETLKRNGAESNALTLVSSANVGQAREVYHYLCDLGIYYHQYIPCVEFDEQGQPLPWTISGAEWGDFLCQIFDHWYQTDTRRVSLRLFDALLSLLVEGKSTICHLGRNCCQYFVVEYNGDLYPCDFFVEAERKLGNIATDSWEDLLRSSKYLNFGRQKAQWNSKCARCEFLPFCSGDCLKHRLFTDDKNPRTLSWLCEGWRQFYEHTLPQFQQLAWQLREERRAPGKPPREEIHRQAEAMNLGRNDPCPCGSGKKYKKCCGAGT